MTKRFYVFDRSKKSLEESLDSAGKSLDDLYSDFDLQPWIHENEQSNNPWQFELASGEVIELGEADSHSGTRFTGYGLPFEGEDEVVNALLKQVDRTAAETVIGMDITASTLTVAPNWQHWCSGTGAGGHFSTRRQAARLIQADRLRDMGLTGQGVNVLVVDQGVSKAYIESLGGTYGGGFGLKVDDDIRVPGQADRPYVKMRREHGSMMVRSLLALAPQAKIYDLPLIPYNISNVSEFALKAVYPIFLATFLPLFIPGPWVAINAWGIDDRFGEQVRGNYSSRASHPLNLWYRRMAQQQDVIFAAGNSGQFCPDPQAGAYDRGPGRSIWGANALENVTCVGAVSGRAEWIGASSQGPGPAVFSDDPEHPNEKPDICAPSWFVEDGDAGLRSGGTSAATAITGGVVAALRQQWGDVSRQVMREALRDGARKTWHTGWNGRMGEGILNVPGVIERLPIEGGNSVDPLAAKSVEADESASI